MRLNQLRIGDRNSNLLYSRQSEGFFLVEKMNQGDISSVQEVEAKPFIGTPYLAHFYTPEGPPLDKLGKNSDRAGGIRATGNRKSAPAAEKAYGF